MSLSHNALGGPAIAEKHSNTWWVLAGVMLCRRRCTGASRAGWDHPLPTLTFKCPSSGRLLAAGADGLAWEHQINQSGAQMMDKGCLKAAFTATPRLVLL